METMTKTLYQGLLNFTGSTLPSTLQENNPDTTVVTIPFGSWADRPAREGCETVDDLLAWAIQNGQGDEIKSARIKLGEKISQSGDTLKSLRLKRNLSQKEVADRLGANQYNISCYETAKHEMVYTTLKKLAQILEVSLDQLGAAIDNTKTLRNK